MQALTQDDDIIEVALSELEVRVTETNGCVCTYSAPGQKCSCAAKLDITDADRECARLELARRRGLVTQLPPDAAEEGGVNLPVTVEQEAAAAQALMEHEERRARRQQIGVLAAEAKRQRLGLGVDA